MVREFHCCIVQCLCDNADDLLNVSAGDDLGRLLKCYVNSDGLYVDLRCHLCLDGDQARLLICNGVIAIPKTVSLF